MKVDKGSVPVNGSEMIYFAFGSGERTLVVIPGLSLTPVSVSAPAVASAYSAFARDYRVLFFDPISDVPENYTVSDMARDTACVIKALGISGADFFGVSMGGMVVQLIAAEYPELVRRAVLGSTHMRSHETAAKIFDEWISLAEQGRNVELNRSFFSHIYSEEYLAKYKLAFDLLEKQGTPGELRRFTALAKACESFNSEGELEKIKCPVLVIGSLKDKVLTDGSSEELAEKLHCELYMYEGYGHAVYDEAPDYRERLKAFFDKP